MTARAVCPDCRAPLPLLRSWRQGYGPPTLLDPEPVPDGYLLLFGLPEYGGENGHVVFTHYEALSGEKLAQYRANGTPLYRLHRCGEAEPAPAATQEDLL